MSEESNLERHIRTRLALDFKKTFPISFSEIDRDEAKEFIRRNPLTEEELQLLYGDGGGGTK